MRGRLWAGMIFVVLALAAAGCGGGSDETTATTAWADGLCSSISTWTTAVTDAGTQLQDAGNLGVDGFKATIDGVVDATETFGDDVRALERPDTESGSEVKAEVDALADELESQAAELRAAIDTDADSISGLLGELSSITGTLSAMGNAVGSAFDSLSNLDASSELESAFEDADSCQALGSTR